MAKALATGEIDVEADRLYAYMADFGSVPWMKGITKAEVTGDGVGMVRAIHAGDGDPILEVLERLDPDAREVGYTITANNPLPVSDYHATCKVVDLGEGRSRLEWGCSFTPKGVDEATAIAQVEGMYGLMVGWVKADIEQA